jgi:hypothetical protein
MSAAELVACIVAAFVGWAVAKAQISGALHREHAAMQAEIRRCQDAAAVARVKAAQLEQELATWYRGCQQGKEDVIAIMPLLIAAHERLSKPEATASIDS